MFQYMYTVCPGHIRLAWCFIAATQEAGIGRIAVQGQSGQKLSKTPSQPTKVVHPSYTESIKGGLQSRTSQA